MNGETLNERYERLCREYRDKFGESFVNVVGLWPYTSMTCDLIERCIERGMPCDYMTDIGLTPELVKTVVI